MPAALPLLAGVGEAAAGYTAAVAATTTMGEVIGGAMMAGGALSAIGGLTGNKSLSNIGSVLGLAGGAAGLATGAWSNVAQTVGSNASTDLAGVSSSLGSAGGDGGLGLSGSSLAGSSADGYTTPNLGSDMGATTATPLGATPGTDASGTPLAADSAAATNPTLAATYGANYGGGAPITPDGSVAQAGAPGAAPAPAAAAPASGGGLLSNFGQKLSDFGTWAQQGENPRLVQAGAGLLNGMATRVGQYENQKNLLSLQEQAAQRARDRLNAAAQGSQLNIQVQKPAGG